MKTNSRGVVLGENIKGVYARIFVTKEARYALLFGFVYAIEQLRGNFLVFVYQCFGYDKVLYTVYSWVLKGLFAHHIVLHHGVAHLESGVNQDAVYTSKHLGIHAAHRGSNDEVGLFGVARLPKKR